MLRTSEPIFAVADVRATITFYRTVLGFESEWVWGDPPTFGAVRSGHVQVMFCLQPDLQPKVDGHQHFFRVHDVQALYEKHKSTGAPILEEIENKPWGTREYVVRDPNGYRLRFAGPASYERTATHTEVLPPHIQIENRMATLDEYIALSEAVGWSRDLDNMPKALASSLLGVVAIDTRTNKAVGMSRACGDGRSFTIWDVIVIPSSQGQRIGSALIEATLAGLRQIGPKGAFVGLFTVKPEFYERLGFVRDHGMHLPL